MSGPRYPASRLEPCVLSEQSSFSTEVCLGLPLPSPSRDPASFPPQRRPLDLGWGGNRPCSGPVTSRRTLRHVRTQQTGRVCKNKSNTRYICVDIFQYSNSGNTNKSGNWQLFKRNFNRRKKGTHQHPWGKCYSQRYRNNEKGKNTFRTVIAFE